VSFASITLCVASQRLFIVAVVYFVIDSVRKRLDTHSYLAQDRDKLKALENTVMNIQLSNY
jgi:hypothetical protein